MKQTTSTSAVDEHDITNVLAQTERRTYSSSNCSGTLAALTGAPVAVTVSAAPNIKLLTYLMWMMPVYALITVRHCASVCTE